MGKELVLEQQRRIVDAEQELVLVLQPRIVAGGVQELALEQRTAQAEDERILALELEQLLPKERVAGSLLLAAVVEAVGRNSVRDRITEFLLIMTSDLRLHRVCGNRLQRRSLRLGWRKEVEHGLGLGLKQQNYLTTTLHLTWTSFSCL
jgi:hypothetical protein